MSAYERIVAQTAPSVALIDVLGLRAAYDQGQAFGRRIEPIEADVAALLEQFANEVQLKLWRNKDKLHAFQQGQQQHALRTKAVERFVAAHDGQFDLPLALWPMLHTGASLPNEQALLDLLLFFDTAATPPPDRVGPAFWTTSSLREAKLHLCEIIVADVRRQWRAAWQPVIDALHAYLQGHQDEVSDSYLLLLDMLFELGDLDAFEQSYDAFRQHSGHAGNPFPWLDTVVTIDTFRANSFPHLFRLLKQIITVKQLRHHADDPTLAQLQRLHDHIQARIDIFEGTPGVTGNTVVIERKGADVTIGSFTSATPVLPTPDIIGFSLPEPDLLQRYTRLMGRVVSAVDTTHSWGRRRAATLGFWHAFLCCRIFKLTTCKNVLKNMPVGTESLALLIASLRGEVAYLTGEYEDAQLQYERAQKGGRKLLHRLQECGMADERATRAANAFLGRLCQWSGNVYMALGDFALAEETYTQVGDYLDQSVPEYALMQAMNLGNLAFLKNSLVDARGYISYEPEELYKLKGDDPTPFLCLKFERNRDALDAAEKHYSMGLTTLLPGVSDPQEHQRWEAILYSNLGNVCWAQAHLQNEIERLPAALCADFNAVGTSKKLYQQALDFYEAAYELAVDMQPPERGLAATCLVSVSELHLLLGECEDAEGKGLAATRTAEGDKQAAKKVLAQAKQLAANAYVAAEQAAFDAMWLINSDIRADVLYGDDEQLEGKDAFYPENSWRIYLTLARVYEHQHKRSRALLTYTRALKTVERMRRFIRSGTWQTAALQNKLQVFESAIHFLYRTDRHEHAAQIFNLTEQLKARAFLDLLEASRLKLEDREPTGRRMRRIVLAERGARLNQALLRADLDKDIAPLVKQQTQLENQLKKLESHMQQTREVGGLNPPILDWEDCRVLLAQHPDLIMLSFTLGDNQSYLLVGDEKGLEVFELPGRTEIEVTVARLLWYVTVKQIGGTVEYATINRQVVALLLGPAIAGGLLKQLKNRRILIIPDGILYYLPFEMLLVDQPVDTQGQPIDFIAYSKPGATTDNVALNRTLLPFYLLYQAGPITYAQSMSVWHMLQTQSLEQPDHTALGVYRVLYAKNTKSPPFARALELGIEFSNLDQTSRMEQVLDAFDGNPEHILRLSSRDDRINPWPPDHQSTEENFTSLLEKHHVRYVLFAGHGVYNDKYPQFSGIIFNMIDPAQSAQETTTPQHEQDGFFGLQDVVALEMSSTELVFLAACQGGIGMLSRGEGVNALTRAFMYRGSPTVIASLWTVDVDATMDLVEAFFTLLRVQPDADKGHLLQEAKKAVSANKPDTYAHPYYWAPFIVMGRR